MSYKRSEGEPDMFPRGPSELVADKPSHTNLNITSDINNSRMECVQRFANFDLI